jgi:hypothetical protein
MFLYAQIYWLAEFGDVSCLQFNYLRVETLTPTWDTHTLTPTWEDFIKHHQTKQTNKLYQFGNLVYMHVFFKFLFSDTKIIIIQMIM